MDDQAIGQFDTLRDEGRLSASEYRRAVLWLGVKDRTAILKALGKLSAADVRALIGAGDAFDAHAARPTSNRAVYLSTTAIIVTSASGPTRLQPCASVPQLIQGLAYRRTSTRRHHSGRTVHLRR